MQNWPYSTAEPNGERIFMFPLDKSEDKPVLFVHCLHLKFAEFCRIVIIVVFVVLAAVVIVFVFDRIWVLGKEF